MPDASGDIQSIPAKECLGAAIPVQLFYYPTHPQSKVFCPLASNPS